MFFSSTDIPRPVLLDVQDPHREAGLSYTARALAHVVNSLACITKLCPCSPTVFPWPGVAYSSSVTCPQEDGMGKGLMQTLEVGSGLFRVLSVSSVV